MHFPSQNTLVERMRLGWTRSHIKQTMCMNIGLQSMVLAAGSSQGGPCEERTEVAPQLLHSCCSSKTAPSLPKAESTSSAGGTSGSLCSKKVKNQCAAAVAERSEENARENTADTKVSKEEGKDMLQAHGEDHSEGGCPTGAHEDHCVTHSQLQPVEKPCQSRVRRA